MRITIDTKEDSKEEIKKLISLLSSLITDKEVVANKNVFEQGETPSGDIFGNIFEAKDREEQSDNKKVKVIGKDDIPDLQIY